MHHSGLSLDHCVQSVAMFNLHYFSHYCLLVHTSALITLRVHLHRCVSVGFFTAFVFSIVIKSSFDLPYRLLKLERKPYLPICPPLLLLYNITHKSPLVPIFFSYKGKSQRINTNPCIYKTL